MNAENDVKIQKLKQLAQFEGVQTEYASAFGMTLPAAPEGLIHVLNALGVAVHEDLSNVDEILNEQIRLRLAQPVEPTAVFWEGRAATLAFKITPAQRSAKNAKAELILKLENGKTIKAAAKLAKLPIKKKVKNGDLELLELQLPIKGRIPNGYHEAKLKLGTKTHKIFIIASPRQAYKPTASEAPARSTGVFSPLYAVRSHNSWGVGDFTDLGNLVKWAYSLGCDFVGTLPMLAAFLDKPIVEPSPYSPVSRIFWNEIYVDPRATDEWNDCDAARKIAESPNFRAEVERQQQLPEVDYQTSAGLKRQVMMELASYFFAKGKDKGREFKQFLKIQPAAKDYAAFRATCEHTNEFWQNWPERMRDGNLQPGDYEERDYQYHLYSQFIVHTQLSKLQKDSTAGKHRGIYLDFPLSAHPGGYDVWRERDSFVHVVSAGCPPDPAHVHGQDWGILPLNPKSIRHNRYDYVRACLSNHMRYTGLLRLDHVMCFYRLFWVPRGKTAKEGVYIRYAMDEFFALLVLESHRNRCTLIGEDLGTVPPEIREAMQKHGILRMYCQQRRLAPNPKEPLAPVPPNCICSLNTHDMPPFAAFWEGLDLDDKMKLGYFTPDQLQQKKDDRAKAREVLAQHLVGKKLLKRNPKDAPVDVSDVIKSMLLLTAGGPAKVMQVNVEDLWLETKSQNVPGTWKERPNWKRKLKHTIEELPSLEKIAPMFKEILAMRKGKRRF